MSNILQTILQIDSPLFKSGLAKLERSTGNSAIDVRLIADISEKAYKKMRLLKLDPADTSAQELYHALISEANRKYVDQFFEDTDYVLAIFDDQVVSMNLIDIVENYHHELSFEKRKINHGQKSLMGELIERYVSHARTNEQTVREIAISIGILESE